jgi:hypothetical protein
MYEQVRKRKDGKTLTKYNRDLCAEPSPLLGLGHTKFKNIKDDNYES